ncbi:MAG: PspA-associated protein PspAA [Candidatus Nitrosocosmicus sp.]
MSYNTNPSDQKKVVRILGHGQFSIDNSVLNELNEIDNGIVNLIENKENNDSIEPEFQSKLKLLETIVKQKGTPIDSKEIVTSDIILPGKDITLEVARKVFKGEGIIKDI